MMLLLRLLCQFHQKKKINTNNVEGFTLIEVLLTIAIISILVTVCCFILEYTTVVCREEDMEDEMLLNGKYAIEHIKKEIQTADKIISIDKFEGLNDKYEKNIGFVILHYFPDKELKYNYSTYYFKNNSIYRIAINTSSESYPIGRAFGGHNKVADYVISIDGTSINFNTNIIELFFTLQNIYGGSSIFNVKTIARCPVIQ